MTCVQAVPVESRHCRAVRHRPAYLGGALSWHAPIGSEMLPRLATRTAVYIGRVPCLITTRSLTLLSLTWSLLLHLSIGRSHWFIDPFSQLSSQRASPCQGEALWSIRLAFGALHHRVHHHPEVFSPSPFCFLFMALSSPYSLDQITKMV